MRSNEIELVPVSDLKHIEGFSEKRVQWLSNKITGEGVWTVPLVIDSDHSLVMDGQHRMEVARRLGLSWAPAVVYHYSDVDVWSLRPQYEFTWETVVARALSGDVYPYKTVKHGFPQPVPECVISLGSLA